MPLHVSRPLWTVSTHQRHRADETRVGRLERGGVNAGEGGE